MTQQKIGPREQQLRDQRKRQVKEHEAAVKVGRQRVNPVIPEDGKDWRKQLSAIKGNRNRKDRRT